MSAIRLLVGTRKGAFILTSDGKRADWKVSGPHFAGWEIYHLKGSPVDPNRIYASQSTRLVRPTDSALERRWQNLGSSRERLQLRRNARHPSMVRWHPASMGIQAGLASRAVTDRSRHGLCGRGGRRAFPHHRRRRKPGRSCPGCGARRVIFGSRAQAGCVCTPFCSTRLIPTGCFVAISAAGAFRTDDGGKTWTPINKGLKSHYELPDPNAEVGHCVHHIAMHPSRPGVLFMQKHWDVMRSDNAGDLLERGE